MKKRLVNGSEKLARPSDPRARIGTANTTNLLHPIESYDLSSAISQEYLQQHKTIWEKALPPQSLPHCLQNRVKNSTNRKPVGKTDDQREAWSHASTSRVNIVHPSMERHSREP